MDECEIRGWYDTPERVIGFMDRFGIDMAVVSTYRNAPETDNSAAEYIIEGCKKYPSRFIPFLRLNPRAGKKAIQLLEMAVEQQRIKGVKLHPASYNLPPFGGITVEIMKKAAHYDIPVLFHCSDELMTFPLQIGEAMRESPYTTVIMAHMGGFFHHKDLIELMKRRPLAYTDTSEFPFSTGIREFIEKLGPDRILFGTDLPTDNPALEIEKIRMLNLGQEIEDKLFYKNAAHLLKIFVKEGVECDY
jgi:predicted TIM-barrel fold metal-dependent hydrolase